jgi:hypothetical protein
VKLCSDAPAISTGQDSALVGISSALASTDIANDYYVVNESEQWDDAALAATTSTSRKLLASTAPVSEVMDMKSLDPKRFLDDGNIAEKLRVEETRAQLVAAREGMEREAARLKEEKEKKEEQKNAVATRFAAATPGGNVGSKWLPPHLRGSGAVVSSRVGMMGGAMGKKLDVQDEELFPDLATADKILEQKEKEQHAGFKVPKKTPVGGGATWASKKPVPGAKTDEPLEEPAVVAGTTDEATPTADGEGAPSPIEATLEEAVAEKPLLKKTATKKKRDIATFKPTGPV